MAKQPWQMRVRKFLNPKAQYNSVAAIYADVGAEGEMNLVISDCRKSITLSLPSYEKGTFMNSLGKLKILRDTFSAMVDKAEEYGKHQNWL